jgi:hypothetical protein
MPATPETTANSTTRKVVEFLHIELASLANGKISVAVTATTIDDDEPQLLNQEIATDQVATVDDALAIIATHVQATMK